MKFRHTIEVTHHRHPIAHSMEEPDSESTVDVRAESTDLIEAWRELLSRLPSDVYQGLREALKEAS